MLIGRVLQVENIIRREMERVGLNDDALEALRTAPASIMLQDMRDLVQAKKDLNTKV